MSFLNDVGLDWFDIGFTLVNQTDQMFIALLKGKPIKSASLTESNQNWIRLDGLVWTVKTGFYTPLPLDITTIGGLSIKLYCNFLSVTW